MLIRRRDGAALASLAAVLAFFFAPDWAGRTYYWGDLTYLHFPWKTYSAQCLQAGRFPHWNPFVYLGMPLHSAFQAGVLYPLSIPFDLFGFETALSAYLPIHFALGALFAYLWLRREGAGRPGAWLASSAFVLGGVWVSHLPFLNHIGALAWMPALFLFPQPRLFAGALAVSALDGYPTMTAGSAAAALLYALWRGRLRPAPAAASLALAFGLSAPLVLPAWPSSAGSVRSLGLPASVVTLYSFPFSDWAQLASPWLLKAGQFDAAIFWWKTSYWGLVPSAAALAGAWRLRRRPAPFLYAAGVLLICLGSGFAPSRWVWEHVPGLSLLRYPGNLLYLLLPPLALWTAAGARAALLCPLAAAELLAYGVGAQPTAPRPFFPEKGPLVERLQATLGEHRYLPSPKALAVHGGFGIRDWKERLFGETNVPYRLRSAGNFGEPLVPRGVYNWMDLMNRRKGPEDLAPYAALADVETLLTPDEWTTRAWTHVGRGPWEIYASTAASHARLLRSGVPEAAPDPTAGLASFPDAGEPLEFASDREDRWSVRGSGPGTVLVSEPEAGWLGWLDGRPARLRPAFGAFVQFEAPAGPFELTARYARALWLPGLALFLAALTAWAAPVMLLFRTK